MKQKFNFFYLSKKRYFSKFKLITKFIWWCNMTSVIVKYRVSCNFILYISKTGYDRLQRNSATGEDWNLSKIQIEPQIWCNLRFTLCDPKNVLTVKNVENHGIIFLAQFGLYDLANSALTEDKLVMSVSNYFGNTTTAFWHKFCYSCG